MAERVATPAVEARGAPLAPGLRQRQPRALPILLLIPALIIFFLLFVLPQAGLLRWSFDPSRGSDAGAPTLENYGRFLGDSHYLEMLGRTLVMGLETTL